MEKELIRRYFDNTATPEEQMAVIRWLTDTSRRDEVLRWIEHYWEDTRQEKMTPPLFDDILRKARIREEEQQKATLPASNRSIWFSVAAASLFFLIAGLWMGYYFNRKPVQDNSGMMAAAQTRKGERTRIVLNDGSEVFLNADTRLMFKKEADNAPQVIYLEGEAYFNQQKESQSLVIKTKDIVTTAKGSQFNISAFPSDSLVKVTVKKGKAEVKNNTEIFAPLLKLRPARKDSLEKVAKQDEKPRVMPLIKLLPPLVVREREQMTFDKKSGNRDVGLNNNDKDASVWKDGILSFNNANKEEITEQLERWFGVKVIISADSGVLPAFTGEFNNASLQEVVSGICNAMQLISRTEGKTIYLIKE